MGKFNKNPLFVVQKDTVEEVENFFEYFIKKMGLEPVTRFLEQILSLIMDSVKDYPTFMVVQGWLEQFIQILDGLVGNFDSSFLSFIKQNILRKA